MDTVANAHHAIDELERERDHWREATALLDRMQRGRVLDLGDGRAVCVGGRYDGWLLWKHIDGHWVTLRKLEEVPREALDGICSPSPSRGLPRQTTCRDATRDYQV